MMRINKNFKSSNPDTEFSDVGSQRREFLFQGCAWYLNYNARNSKNVFLQHCIVFYLRNMLQMNSMQILTQIFIDSLKKYLDLDMEMVAKLIRSG